ncbi:MAG: NAD(P)H-quinone oxidoreductase subunit L, partial [Microcystis sp. M49629_WE12]|nr:NAD(P)H-quinone oxidoreductase subunit L [Microcystis sp. M49629_WE12]
MQSILTQETIIIALIYLSLSVLYLLVIPAVIYYYLNTRWYVA